MSMNVGNWIAVAALTVALGTATIAGATRVGGLETNVQTLTTEQVVNVDRDRRQWERIQDIEKIIETLAEWSKIHKERKAHPGIGDRLARIETNQEWIMKALNIRKPPKETPKDE